MVDSDDESVECLGTTQEVENLPHCRADCLLHPFKTTAHNIACKSCWCYVCEVPVAHCVNWSTHCDANPNNKAFEYTWKKMREEHRKSRKAMSMVSADFNDTNDAAILAPKKKAKRKQQLIGQKRITSFFRSNPSPTTPHVASAIRELETAEEKDPVAGDETQKASRKKQGEMKKKREPNENVYNETSFGQQGENDTLKEQEQT